MSNALQLVCEDRFENEAMLSVHIKNLHADVIPKDDLSTIVQVCLAYDRQRINICPVCSINETDWKRTERRMNYASFQAPTPSWITSGNACTTFLFDHYPRRPSRSKHMNLMIPIETPQIKPPGRTQHHPLIFPKVQDMRTVWT